MVALFCVEALAMAVIGIAVGLLLAQQLAEVALASVEGTVNRFVLPIHPPPPRISLEVALIGAGAGFVTTLLAAYFPARQTNRVDPAEALRASRATSMMGTLRFGLMAAIGLPISCAAYIPAARGGEINGYLASFLLVAGLALMAPLAVKLLRLCSVGLVERLLGIPGRLALDNVERSLGRSAITVVALMLAVGMSMSVGAYAHSFEASVVQWADDAFPADAVVTAGSPLIDRHHVPFAPSVLDKLKDVPGVAGVNPTRIIFHDVLGRRAQVASMDTYRYFTESEKKGRSRHVTDGPQRLDARALVDAQRVIISENLANFHNLGAGDTLTLDTPSGEQTFSVYAVVLDYSTDQGWLMMDRKWYSQAFSDEQIDGIDLFFSEGANREAAVRAVRERLGGTDGLFVTLHDALRAQLKAVAENVFAIAKAPELITLLVAIMGVIGTMLAAVIDRIREIGMLRAIGATRRQVVQCLVVEAAFLGVAAVVCGVLGGVPQGYIFLKVIGTATSGWNLPYAFPVDTALRITLFVVGAAALAGFFPGRRAAAIDVKEALAYE
jgi:putative ABC transport system permease protein